MDIQWPARRIEKVLKNAQITVALCSEDQKSHLEAVCPVKVLPVTPKLIYRLKKATNNDVPLDLPSVSPEAPAYIMHTSGSTGQPKGIEISHRSITTSINAMVRYFSVSSSTRTLQFSAFTFDVSVADVWATLSCGGRVCMPSEEQRFSLTDFVLEERCNNAFMTPSAAATIDPEVPKKHMRRLVLIGEAVKTRFLRQYAPTTNGDQNDECLVFYNSWGPTEASVFATSSAPITVSADGRKLEPRAGNIGRPLGCGLFIVSARNPNALSPAFVPGEIALVGPTLATGYWRNETETNFAFRTDLEWAKEKRWRDKLGDAVMDRVYLTGDVGRFSEEGDGTVVFMHRRGGYVKVNGFRIDPGEVESAIVEVGETSSKGKAVDAPYWESAVVCALERAVGEVEQQMLVCFLAESELHGEPGAGCEKVRMSEEKKSLLRDVAEGLKHILPEYMTPKLFVSVAQMPHTTSSKMDRAALLGLLDGMDWSELVEVHALGSEPR